MSELQDRLSAAVRAALPSSDDRLEDLLIAAVMLQDRDKLDRLHVVEERDQIRVIRFDGEPIRITSRPATVASDWSGHLPERPSRSTVELRRI